MSAAQNKAMNRRIIEEVFNQRHLALIEDCYAPTHVGHTATGVTHGPAAYQQLLSSYFAAFPDLQFTLDDLLADGDTTVSRWTAQGTNTGSLAGLPPTGKSVTMTGVTITRWADGKAVETWITSDTLSLMQQLGVVPDLAQAGSQLS